jgi:hypothetical protein
LAKEVRENLEEEISRERKMGKNIVMSALLLVATFLFNLSCEEKTTKGGERTDFEAIKAIIYENPDIFLVDVFDTDKDTSVNPIFFREINSTDFDLDSARRYDADTLHYFNHIYAAWGDSMRGILHYFIDEKEHTESIYVHSGMGAYFEQWGDILDPHRGWLLKEISNNVIASVPTHIILPTVHITSQGIDTWVSEGSVSTMLKKDSVVSFAAGKKVTFTVDSEDISDLFLFLHIGEDGNFKKIPFADNGDGTSSASWTTTSDPEIAKGYKHAFVDAISREALTDTTAEYDSKAWGIIYRLK